MGSRQERLRLEQTLGQAAECKILLEAYSDPEPRPWRQKCLRASAETLRGRGNFFEALAAERYVGAGSWSVAMGILQPAGFPGASPPPSPPARRVG